MGRQNRRAKRFLTETPSGMGHIQICEDRRRFDSPIDGDSIRLFQRAESLSDSNWLFDQRTLLNCLPLKDQHAFLIRLALHCQHAFTIRHMPPRSIPLSAPENPSAPKSFLHSFLRKAFKCHQYLHIFFKLQCTTTATKLQMSVSMF